jgi:hypothetical protein
MHFLKSVNATAHVAQLASKYNAKWANQAAGSRFYIQNALELLDSVGEFYVDAGRRRVLLRLAPGDDPNQGDDPIVLAAPLELLQIDGDVEGVTFQNVIFAHTAVEATAITRGLSGQSGDFLQTAAVHVRHARDVKFLSCSFHATGGYAFWAEEEAHGAQLSRCHAFDLGAGAVRFGSGHDAVSEGHAVYDSVLRDGGYVWQEGCGVLAQKVQNVTLSHNEIHHFRYTGVSTGWTWGYAPTVVHNVVTSNNHIHDLGLGYLSDMGCVYTLGHQPGSRVVNNFCHDVQSFNYGGWAFYTDEGSRDEMFSSNVAVRTKCAGHHQHYGTDNNITNNIYYDVNIGDVPTPGRPEVLMHGHCDAAVRASTHSRDPKTCSPDKAPHAGCCCYPGCDQGKCSSFKFARNIVFLPVSSNSTFVGTGFSHGLDNFTFINNTYFAKGRSPSAPLFNFTLEPFDAWQLAGKDAGSGLEDPQFLSLDPTFTLSSTSPAIGRGFIPIDTSVIGPRASAGASGRSVAPSHAPQVRELVELGLVVDTTGTASAHVI